MIIGTSDDPNAVLEDTYPAARRNKQEYNEKHQAWDFHLVHAVATRFFSLQGHFS